MLIASYCKTILLTSTDTEVQKNGKSGIEMLYNSYTAYIQRFKLFAWLFERLVFVLVEEEVLFCRVVGP